MEKICQLRWGSPTAPPGYTGAWGIAPIAGPQLAGPPPTAGPMDSEEVMRRMIQATGGLPHAPPGAAQTPADEAEFLLQVASEVEHGLLVQYLYAAYSTTDVGTDPGDGSGGWQGRLINIAVQEMDHLLNVQNMLLALGRRPYFGRGNFPPSPERAEFYPFPFQFEPLSENSLGTYVTAESPSEVLGTIDLSKLTADQRAWLPRAVASGTAAAGGTINHVGVLYATIYWMFQEDDTPVAPWKLPADQFAGKVHHVSEADFAAAATLHARQGTADEFKSQPGPEPDPPPDSDHPHRVVWSMTSRADVRNAIAQIAAQGEGTEMTAHPHFVEFLQLFGEFVTRADAGSAPPVLALPINPNTANDPATIGARITHPVSLLWAQLFNIRYRILLTELALALSESTGENAGGNGLATRETLVSRAITREMKAPFGISGLTQKLLKLPLRSDGTGVAAPPFEMPDSPLPTEPGAHRDFLVKLLADAAPIIDKLLALSGADALSLPIQNGLKQLKNADALYSADVSLMTFTP
jgi:hypothetical protein